MIPLCYIEDTRKQGCPALMESEPMGVWARAHYGVPNKGRLGSGVPHREPSVLHVIVEAVAGDLGASQASSQLPGEGGGG